MVFGGLFADQWTGHDAMLLVCHRTGTGHSMCTAFVKMPLHVGLQQGLCLITDDSDVHTSAQFNALVAVKYVSKARIPTDCIC